MKVLTAAAAAIDSVRRKCHRTTSSMKLEHRWIVDVNALIGPLVLKARRSIPFLEAGCGILPGHGALSSPHDVRA
jgi:hypothetical protein